MTRPPYPNAPRWDLVEEVHGRPVPDPYRWLEDPDDPATGEWARAQDELFARQQETWPSRPRFREQLAALLAAGYVSPPAWRGDRQFLTRRLATQEHGVLLTVDPGGRERVLVDPMALDPTGATTLDAWQPSKEGDLLAYQLSVGGTEESVVHVLDVATGRDVDGPIGRARYSPVAWLPGGKAFFYSRRLAPDRVPPGEEQYHRRVWLHTVGTPADDDIEVFGAGLDKTTYFGLSVSRDGRWLVVTAAAGTAPRTDVWLADLAAAPVAAPDLRPVQVGVDARTAAYVGRDGRLYLHTERDAPRGRLCVTDPRDPAYERWRTLVPEDPEAVLEDYAVLDGDPTDPVLLASWTRHAASEITVHDLATGAPRGAVTLPGTGSVGGLSERPEGGHEAWFGYTDHTTPPAVYRFDATTGETTLWARAPGTVEVPAVDTQQVTYASADGTLVRMFVISPTGRPDRPRPAILNGYGGFGIAQAPTYSASVLAWVAAGGVYAVPGIRGGGEEGESWHRAAMGPHRQRSFDDFHAAADWLVDQGWTTPRQLALSGGSNGGLLVGVALTQRPERYAAVACSAPLLDMVRYERFGLGATWHEEYGSAADPEQLGWLLAYSPYHHVHPGVAYPAVLFTVFDGDTRVDPLHARKMCAALQHASTGGPVLLRRERDVGHGARALSRSIDLTADVLAFLAHHTGLDHGGPGAGRGRTGAEPGPERGLSGRPGQICPPGRPGR